MAETKVKKRTGRVSQSQEMEHNKQKSEEGTRKKRIGKIKNREKEQPQPENKPVRKGKTKKTKKKGSSSPGIDFARTLRSVFLLSVGLLIVYVYYLQTEGVLVSGIQNIWREYKQALLSILVFVAYSALIFYLGFRKGRKR
ncbi:hypothetical protein ACFOU2_20320 [Bacillus songklensis]|uniref:Uncharacterized protein n=1 Tax=Bacillus songklensis TaxID=1069116 RepID=A0ABV8B8I0_9BACI